MDERQDLRRRKWRAIAIGWALAGLAILFYAATIVRFGRGMLGPL
jgi:hypothetical protein